MFSSMSVKSLILLWAAKIVSDILITYFPTRYSSAFVSKAVLYIEVLFHNCSGMFTMHYVYALLFTLKRL